MISLDHLVYPLRFLSHDFQYFNYKLLSPLLSVSGYWLMVMTTLILYKGHFFFKTGSFVFIYTYTKVIFLGVCSFISYLFVNICAPLHDLYIFTCHKILDKLQETFVLEIRYDESKRWLNRKLFLPHYHTLPAPRKWFPTLRRYIKLWKDNLF